MTAKFKKFAVVEFLDEKKKSMCAMDVICSSWLINESLVFWPNHLGSSRLLTAIREATLTPESNWKQLKIRILYYSDSYETAVERIETLEFTSSNETAPESDEELSMPPAKKLAVCNTSDTEVYPSVSPRLKKSFNCQNILQPTTV
ncbi:uncharacterized protein LOC124809971 [Hydra vulgaris]|uniref:uncharacterized protein LOC124809971 n=1 Tax=Hydra vulgaris TaxID=6087 RepID=UPI000192456A|nr:uncharacterized protein LOC124809971 [Hydra vulgaris]